MQRPLGSTAHNRVVKVESRPFGGGFRMRMGLFALALALSAVVTSCSGDSTTPNVPNLTTITIVNGTLNVQGGGYSWYSFTAPSGGTFSGNFTATGGTDSKIEVMVMTAPNFELWQANGSVNVAYYSGELTTASANLQLPAGQYRLVLSGKKNFFDRAVAAHYTFVY